MFVKKLVEKASKKPGGNLNGLKSGDVNPRLVFHNGIPAGSVALAYDSVQKILAISTKDGRIKLFGKDNTQLLLESDHTVPTKFLQFLENKGVLFNVTAQNHIQVWDIERKRLSDVYIFKEEITSFTVIQDCFYLYVGNSVGNIFILKLDEETLKLVQMKYNIPVSASHGKTTEVAVATAVQIMPQPRAESKRVLIIYTDGLIVLWELEESKVIFVTGGNVLVPLSHETKKVTCACWACPHGSKVVVGYSNGEIYLWNIPSLSNPKHSLQTDTELPSAQGVPISKLNLGYKMEKIPILSLKWVFGEGKSSRLYVNGTSSSLSSNSFQIVLLNEQSESRTIKLILPLTEPCLDMQLISSMSDQNKQKQDSLLLLLKSGRLCTYDDSMIEKYLLQSQSRSSPSLPKQMATKLPFSDSSITTAKFITDDSNFLTGTNEEYKLFARNLPDLFSSETKVKDGSLLNSAHVGGFMKIKNLYITGHNDGTINFWDLSCPFLLPISSVKQQSDDDNSSNGIPVTALYFDNTSKILVSGDQSGIVHIFKLKPEMFSTENNLLLVQGTKKGNNYVHSVKLIKVNGVVLSISIDRSSRHLAVGSDQGNVSVIDIEGPTVLYQNQITSELCNEIISLQFETCSLHGFEKNILLVVTKDSSILALESDSGSTLSTSMIHPKKLSKALFMQILDVPDDLDLSKGSSVEDAVSKESLLLLCNEKAVYLYSLIHAIQGIKKVLYKKKIHGTFCCWASTFFNRNSGVALVLLFSNGKIEIRSLPELSLLKESSIRGLTVSATKSNQYSDSSLCSSVDGEIILVNGDQEVFHVSLLLRKEIYRYLDPISDVYQKGVMVPKEEFVSAPVLHKEKKKGIFSSVIQDLKGNRPKQEPESEVENSRASVADELSIIFLTANFPLDTERKDHPVVEEDEVELNIDDIEFDDLDEKPKGNNMIAAFQKEKLASKFQAIKGKLKLKMVKNDKASPKAEYVEEKPGSVDQIKKKYGFPMGSELNVAKVTENRLQENVQKLQGINTRATEMQDKAQSFSSLAKEVLRIRTVENDRRNSS